jgi:hypothetical protein
MLSLQGNWAFFTATFLMSYIDEYLEAKSKGLLTSEA